MSTSTSAYHLANLHHHHEGSSSSVPTTPKSNGATSTTSTSKQVFRYDPYNNFNKVVYNCSSSSRGNSRSTTPHRNNNSSRSPHSVQEEEGHQHQVEQEQQQQYCYKNNKVEQQHSSTNANPLFAECEQLDVVSGACTPTNRMETEQQFPTTQKKQQQEQEQEQRRSSLSSHDQEEDHHFLEEENSSSTSDEQQQQTSLIPKPRSQANNNNNKAQEQEQEEEMRASVRTMQHLLQNVPYLFLDLVAESTILCRDPNHRVGQKISAWSSPQSPQEIIASRPDYEGQTIRDVFVAQLPFDLPLSSVQLVADLLIEGPRVHVLHAAPHIKANRSYDGCCFVKMFEADAIRFINAMHKRVLFDVDGIWVATSLPELQELTDYCAWFQEQKNEQRKEILKMPTPFSAMTAEFALRGCKKNISHNNAFNNNNSYNKLPHHPQYQQQQQQMVMMDQNPHQRQVAQHLHKQYNQYHNNHYNNHQQQQQQQQQYYPPQQQHQHQHGAYQAGYSYYNQQQQQQQQQYPSQPQIGYGYQQ